MQFDFNSLFLALISLNAFNAQWAPVLWNSCAQTQVDQFCGGDLFDDPVKISANKDRTFKCQQVSYIGNDPAITTMLSGIGRTYQCLPVGYKGSIQVFNPNTANTNQKDPNGLYRIWNSWKDDCTPGAGASFGATAGCGSGLHCVKYTVGSTTKYTCGPAMFAGGSFMTAAKLQTCGTSSSQGLSCNSGLSCISTTAYAGTITTTKRVCFDKPTLSRRAILICYNGGKCTTATGTTSLTS